MRCKGCKYVGYVWEREARVGFHVCNRFKHRGERVFLDATDAYDYACKGKYHRVRGAVKQAAPRPVVEDTSDLLF